MSYKTAIEGKKAITPRDQNFYALCLSLKNRHNSILLNYDNKLIAFWCTYDNKVKVGYGANEQERNQIINFQF